MCKFYEDPLDYRLCCSNVKIELSPPFAGEEKQRCPCWARQYEVAVKALIGDTGGDYDVEVVRRRRVA